MTTDELEPGAAEPEPSPTEGGAGPHPDEAPPAGAAGDPAADPIFQREEPDASGGQGRNTVLLWQFFLFPLLIVAAVVGLLVVMGLFTGGTPSPDELLHTVVGGGDNQKQQAAHQLALVIAQERNRQDLLLREGKTSESPPFYADPSFRRELRGALATTLRELAEEPDSTDLEQRARWLAQAVGRTQDPEGVAQLLGVLYPGGEASQPQEIRRAAALGVAFTEDRMSEPALQRMARDPADSEVRDIAVNALALLGLPRHGGAAADQAGTREVLRAALEDDHAGVRFNAAVALAIRKDPTGRGLIRKGLTRAGLSELGIHPMLVPKALRNAIRAAEALRDPELRPLVAALVEQSNEGDDQVRAQARRALATWGADD